MSLNRSMQQSQQSLSSFRSKISKSSPQELTSFLGWDTKKRSLYWYQADHVKQMLLTCIQEDNRNRHGMILADEMGLGKTLQSLSVAAGLEEIDILQPPAVFVIPKPTLDSNQWVDEALNNTRWSIDEIVVYHGSNRRQILEDKMLQLQKYNTEQMDIRFGSVLNKIQKIFVNNNDFDDFSSSASSSTIFQQIMDECCEKIRKDAVFVSELKKRCNANNGKQSLITSIMSCFWDNRYLWNPGKRIRLIFTTPHTVVSEGGDDFLNNFQIGSLFYDEAHDIRNGVKASKLNGRHKTSKAMFALSRRIRSSPNRYPTFALSGTIIVNDYDDMISVLHFIGQHPENDPAYFQNSSTRTQRLEEANRKYLIRGLKADLLNLPDRYMAFHFFHFNQHEVKRSEALMQQLQMLYSMSENTDGKEKQELQNKMRSVLTRMRQQCISEELISNKELIDTLYTKAYVDQVSISEKEQNFILNAMEASTKLLHFVQDIYKRSNGKCIHTPMNVPSPDATDATDAMDLSLDEGELIIVTSEWVMALKLIALMIHCPKVKQKYLPEDYKAPILYMYNGQMNQTQKKFTLDAAKASAKNGIPSVLLLSFHSGAVGLNLFFSRSIMILEGWWNKALMDQMAARVHRNGQTKDCDIHQYIINGTIEQHILWLQDDKHLKAMEVYGNSKEKDYARQQKDKRGGNKKGGFKIKDAVVNMKKIRKEYAEQTQHHSLLNKGFRSKIEVILPEKDIRQTHSTTIKDRSTPIEYTTPVEHMQRHIETHITHISDVAKKRKWSEHRQSQSHSATTTSSTTTSVSGGDVKRQRVIPASESFLNIIRRGGKFTLDSLRFW